MKSFNLDPQPFYRKILRYELVADTAQDLYEKNYSTVKSTYGLDSLGDGTWTGLVETGTDASPATVIYTDTGEVLLNDWRYRDTRVSINIVSVDTTGATLYTSPVGDSSEWVEVEYDTETGEYTKLSRYLKSDINATVTLEVGPSLHTAIYTEAVILADMFPEWMTLRTDQTSHGFRLLNVMAQEIEELKKHAIVWPNRSFVQLMPEGIKAFAYFTIMPDEEDPIDVIGYVVESPAEYYQLSPAEDLQEFIEAEEEKHLYYREGRYLFTCSEYELLEIDGLSVPQEKVHIVNWFDNIGAYIGLERLPEETNREYKRRILDVFVNPPGASVERITAAIERDSGCTGLHVFELADSQVPWAEPNDPGTSGVFYQEATEEHKDLARWCNENGKVGYDYFRWGQTLFDLYPHPWDLAEIPYYLDQRLSDFSPALTREPGIGFGYDLIAAPYEHRGSFPYSVYVKARGFLYTTQQYTPPVTVSGRVVPSATLSEYHNEFDGYVCIECTTSDSPSETYCMNLEVYIPRDRLVASNTNFWQYMLPQLGSSQPLNMAVKTDTTGELIEVPADTIVTYELKDGRWNFATQTLVDNDPADSLTLSFLPTEDSPSYDSNPWDVDVAGEHPKVIYAEYETSVSATTDDWTGNGSPFTITCNNNQATQDAVLYLPQNLEAIEGLGTITYTLVVDSVSPSGASIDGSPADTFISFWDYASPATELGSTIVGTPPSEACIVLSSTYEQDADVYTPSTDDTELVFAGSVSIEEPVAYHTITVSDFSLAANFVDAKYEIKAAGEVLARLPKELSEDEDTLVVELNPVYMFEWPPKVAPGTLYLSGNEYYLHANSETESVSGTEYVLTYPIAPGAPLSFNEPLVEIHMTDSNGLPTLTVTQEVYGNGTEYLPIWYDNAVDIEVEGVSKTLLNTNIIDYGSVTDEDTSYTITYEVEDSYCVDYSWIEDDEYRPKIYLQASHPDLTVTYTPYNEEGYWIDTDIPTNPVTTHKNRDFLYIDDESVSVDSVEILTLPSILYTDRDNLILAIVKDSDGNGVPGIAVSVTTDDAQHINATSNGDGYVSVFVVGPASPGTLDVTVTTDASPSEFDTVTYTVVDEIAASPEGLYLVEQEFQAALASTTQTIGLLLLDGSGDPVETSGTYTIWCSDDAGNDGPHSIATDASGYASLVYAPDTIGRYVATFTINSQTKYVGWEIIERI